MTEAMSILTDFKKKSLLFKKKKLRWLNIYLYMRDCVCERPRLHM